MLMRGLFRGAHLCTLQAASRSTTGLRCSQPTRCSRSPGEQRLTHSTPYSILIPCSIRYSIRYLTIIQYSFNTGRSGREGVEVGREERGGQKVAQGRGEEGGGGGFMNMTCRGWRVN